MNKLRGFCLLACLLGGQAFAQAPCDNALEMAAKASHADEALALLGACLAAPAPNALHAPVVLEMARLSLQAGALDDVHKYLDILKSMLEPEDLGADEASKPTS